MVLCATDDDIILFRITSQFSKTNYDFEITDWKAAGLLSQSFIRLHKVATIESTLIEKCIGAVPLSDKEKVLKQIQQLLPQILQD